MTLPDFDEINCRRVKDGVVFDNLRPGKFKVAGEMLRHLQQASDEGRFWPYRVVQESCDLPSDTYIVRVEEQ